MNGPQDLGGMQCFGAVPLEEAEPVFHAEWERRVLALTLAAGALGHWTLDESRHARESLPPAIYYGSSYYEIWLRALEALLLGHGLVSADELRQGRPERPAEAPHPRRLRAADVDAVLARGGPADRPANGVAPRFAVGQAVIAREMHPSGHTRLPRYARGKPGRVVALRGHHLFPDRAAHGEREAAEWLYGIAFEGRTLWGADAEPGLTVTLDAWESYLDAV